MSIENLVALFTLTLMEIVLGIDNIIFIAILTSKLTPALQQRARALGMGLALVFRIALLFSLTWLMKLSSPLFKFIEHPISGRDLILITGGLFLIAKSTSEIHQKITESDKNHDKKNHTPAETQFINTVFHICLIDIVFSIDSVITAVGMVQNLSIMITAVVISMLIMLKVSHPISLYIEKNPTLKVLALSFLILIGVMLLMEGSGAHVSKSYLYFAMAFAFSVEMINIKIRKK